MSNLKMLPPKGFRPVGTIERVEHSRTPPPFVKNTRRRGRRAEGIRYERKAHEHLRGLYAEHYAASPWFRFREVGAMRDRWCQPDGLLVQVDIGRITIIECKLQHTADAWWQLKWLYLPVIAKAFPANMWTYAVLEMTKWFDPATVFPEKIKMRANVVDAVPGEFGVHIWKP